MASDDQLVSDAVLALRAIQERQPEARQFILCDPVLFDPASVLESERRTLDRVSLKCPEVAPELAPYLVAVGSDWAGEHLLQDSIELALREVQEANRNIPSPRSVCAWLFVKQSDEQRLNDRLGQRAKLYTTARGANEKLFRYWDPRVFVQLPRIIGPEPFAKWLGVEVRWCWMDAAGVIRQHPFVTAETHGSADDPMLLGRLRRIAEINQCLVHAEKSGKDDEAVAGAYFDLLLVAAEKAGCRTPVDRMTYAVLADSLGKGFERVPQLSGHMEPFLSGSATFSACAATVPQEMWDSVRTTRHSPEFKRETETRS